ncbi:MAG: SoxR reducing system RseC family protein, partial [Clostridia bacterium]|nr:SoxR reducing system RseC family protein [Clostridia bacterium]
MEQAIGIVTEINGSMAKVKIDRKGMCGDSCATCKSICSMHDTVLQARNTANAQKGDLVTVQIPTRKGLLAMIITYGVPLLYAVIITVLMAVFIPEKAGAILLIAGIAA